jgi:hypothetical protein
MKRASIVTVLFLGLSASSLGCLGTRGAGGTGGTSCAPVDDKNPCTDDVCVDGVPSHPAKAAQRPLSPDRRKLQRLHRERAAQHLPPVAVADRRPRAAPVRA